MIFTQARSYPRKKRYNYTIYWNSKELPSLVREDGSCHHHEYNKTKKNNSYNDVTVPVDNSEKLKKRVEKPNNISRSCQRTTNKSRTRKNSCLHYYWFIWNNYAQPCSKFAKIRNQSQNHLDNNVNKIISNRNEDVEILRRFTINF